MQIVINIDEDEYNNMKLLPLTIAEDIIINGTVLPEGHGRLFILDEELTKKFFTSFSFSCQKWISEVGISNATLKVIEADKGGE